MNTIKYMKKQGITTYGTPEKKKNIRISKEGVKINIPRGSSKKAGVTAKKLGGAVWEGVKRTGRGLAIMSQGTNKKNRKSKRGTGKVRQGFENAYNNFYGK